MERERRARRAKDEDERTRRRVAEEREIETFRRDGTRGIYAVGCRRRVDCEPRSINNDTTASTTVEVVRVVGYFVYPLYHSNLKKMDLRADESIELFYSTRKDTEKFAISLKQKSIIDNQSIYFSRAIRLLTVSCVIRFSYAYKLYSQYTYMYIPFSRLV